MMKKLLVAFLIAHGGCGCSNEEKEPTCVFDGTYEVGGLSTICPDIGSKTIVISNTEDECWTTIEQVALNGARQVGFMSCEAGDPVVECSGFMNDSDGCSWDMYTRRIAK